MEEPKAPTWVDNWARLGLVSVTDAEAWSGAAAYDWVATRPEYTRLGQRPDINRLGFDKGLITVTDFGRYFFRAVTE